MARRMRDVDGTGAPRGTGCLTRRFERLAALTAYVSQGESVSDWTVITSSQCDRFAAASGGRRLIQVDGERRQTTSIWGD